MISVKNYILRDRFASFILVILLLTKSDELIHHWRTLPLRVRQITNESFNFVEILRQ